MNLKEVVDGNEISNSLKGEEFFGYYFLKKTGIHGGLFCMELFLCCSEVILMSSGEQLRVWLLYLYCYCTCIVIALVLLLHLYCYCTCIVIALVLLLYLYS
jgi:hypothetical protein